MTSNDTATGLGAGSLSGDTSLVLPEFDTPPADPIALVRQWRADAAARGVREPDAVVLATSDGAGDVSTRVVSIKEIEENGLVFTSFRDSRKGRDLRANPSASLTFYWRETLQQISVVGRAEIVDAEESDRLFRERPRAAQATTAVSKQSRPLDDEQALRDRARALLDGQERVDRPGGWSGYRLRPSSVEFWYGSPDRLHRRLRYDRTGDGAAWTHQRLQP